MFLIIILISVLIINAAIVISVARAASDRDRMEEEWERMKRNDTDDRSQ